MYNAKNNFVSSHFQIWVSTKERKKEKWHVSEIEERKTDST